MTSRERNLAILVGALVVCWGGWSAWGSFQEALDNRRAAVDEAQLALERARLDERRVKEAALEDLVGYQERSLPADPQVAQQEYLAWLLDELEAAGLDFDDVTLTERRPRGEAFTSLSYTAKAEGDLTAVTKFLHSFYDSPALHKMTLLKLTPLERGRLRLNFNVSALAVSGADRSSGVPVEGSQRPLLGGVEQYLTSITERDVFSRYVPPPPPRPEPRPRPVVRRDPPPPPPKFDDAAHAVVTGIVQAGEELQAWITVRTTGEVLRLSAGDELHVGLIEGTVESITTKQIVYQSGGDRFATPLGASLREGEKLVGDALF